MTREELIECFYQNHQRFIDYVNELPDEKFVYAPVGKWTAGQQLSHLYLCLLPFLKSLPNKEFILQKFGRIDRPLWDYKTLVENYMQTNRKAPERFHPAPEVKLEDKAKIGDDLKNIALCIQKMLEAYSDDELDSLVLPHPLLGNLTIREMFYLMAYHPLHHLKQIEDFWIDYKNE